VKKYLKRVLLGMLLLVGLVVVPFLVINSIDEVLDPGAAEVLNRVNAPRDIPGNAFYALVGYRLSGSEAVETRGRDYVQELAVLTPDDRLTRTEARFDHYLNLPKALTCNPILVNCLVYYQQNKAEIEKDIAPYRALINDYENVVNRYSNFYDISSTQWWTTGLFSTHKLYLTQLVMDWNSGNREAVLNRLDSNIRFWKMMLGNSDTLITKMIAVSILKLDYYFVGELINTCQECRGMKIFNTMLSALTDKEMDLTPSLEREFATTVGIIQKSNQDNKEITKSPIDYFYRENRTVNILYQMMQDQIAITRADKDSMGKIAREMESKYVYDSDFWWLDLYVHPVGKVLAGISWINPENYVTSLRETDAYRARLLRQVTAS
jgi:hypothetical protein